MPRPRSLSLSRSSARRQFRLSLLAWYDTHARDLPWRRTRDPYSIWVSEVMLQQTRVAAVIERYQAFLHRFPTIAALASAGEPDVLALWSGLGYYRRARMLHRAAQTLTQHHNANLPSTASALATLPGIGSYTSAAIASIAFGEAVAVVDGNVERVIMRLHGWSEMACSSESPLAARIQQRAKSLLDPLRPGDFNQAMMELGATTCLPRRPLCLQCPVYDYCRTRGEHPTTPRTAMLNRQIAYALVRRPSSQGEQVTLQQRPSAETVMPGMWELPSIDPATIAPEQILITVRHAIMQTNYSAAIALLTPGELPMLPPSTAIRQWFDIDRLPDLPLTGLARKVLIRAALLPGRTKQPEITSAEATPRPHPTDIQEQT